MTDTILFAEKNNIRMVAHRGVSGLERENTCPAFVAAGVKSYYGIESDVRTTKDGRFVMHHDASVERLTGVNAVIAETDFQTLRSLAISDTDQSTCRGDLFLPTLEEYLSICRKYQKTAVLELKEYGDENTLAIAKTVEAFGMLESTVFISFLRENLLCLRKHFPTAPMQFLSEEISDEVVQFILENGFDADIRWSAVTKEFVDFMHANGRIVNVWTVNTVERATYLASLGVDMITTNILE